MSIHTVRLVLLGVGLLAASCQSLPPIPTSDVDEILTQSAPTPPTAAIPPRLDLATAQRIALGGSPTIHQFLSRIQAAQSHVRRIRSTYRPQLSVNVDATHRHDIAENQLIPFPLESYEQYSGTMTTSWLLFDGHERYFQTLAAEHGYAATVAAYDDARRVHANAVARAFYRSVQATLQRQIAEADIRFHTQLVHETATRYDAGHAAKSDVQTLQIAQSNAQIRRLDAQHDRANARTVMAELMGLGNGQLPDAVVLVMPTDDHRVSRFSHLDDAVAFALSHRADIRQLSARVNETNTLAHAARAAMIPKVTASGSVGVTVRDDIRAQQDDLDTSIGLQANWPLYTGHRLSAEYNVAVANAEAAIAALRERQLAVISDIRQSMAAINTIQKKLDVQSDIVTLAAAVRDTVQHQFSQGTVPITRLNEAQRDLTVAREHAATFRAQLGLALSDLDAAVGDASWVNAADADQ